MGRSWRPLSIYIAALYLATATLCALQLLGLRHLDGGTLAASSVFLVVSTLLMRHSAVLGTSEVGLENIATIAACITLPPPLLLGVELISGT
jgi:hypothetical protein